MKAMNGALVLSEKKSFILRIDTSTFKVLEKWAADEFRSVNGQIEYLLHQAMAASGRTKNPEDPPKKVNKNEPGKR